ncbi:MAG TPA: amidase [Terriglobales bacterium]
MQTALFGGASTILLPALAGARVQDLSGNIVPSVPAFELDELSIGDLQAAMTAGKHTASSLAELYLGRIAQIDQKGVMLKSVIEVNPDAISIALNLDRERKQKGSRGPLHGIPILIKDNIDTGDKMQTTAGSLALVGRPVAKDAYVVQKLREAGVVILGKTNLSEWANIRSNHSSSGWSGRGGQTKNPYALDRNPCGSSSGSGAATAANLCAVAVGTETDGSVICPSSVNGLVGIKPTLGLVSRSGIIPIAHSQDTAGPMARSVKDAAILLGAMAGTDPSDKATAGAASKLSPDYTKFLDPNGLRGARLGVARKYFGSNDAVDRAINKMIDAMKQLGAVIIDPADLPSHGKFDDTEFTVLLYELRADLNAYLAARNDAPVKTLEEVIAFNERNRDREMPYFGQEVFIRAQAKGPLTDKEYLDAIEANHRLSRTEGIDAVMDKFNLDAIVAPSGSPAWLTDLISGDHGGGESSNAAAVAGYPNITVPAGMVFGLPIGISFFGRAWSESKLVKIAYGFEQAIKARRPPQFLASAQTG